MEKIVIYCKSYRNDLLRCEKLARSIAIFNRERIPFYVSVPDADMSLFRNLSDSCEFILISDEEILEHCPNFGQKRFNALSGGIQQQIVKSEFWRLKISDCYLCIDSDSEFIRDFYRSDFITEEGIPYTTISDAHQLLETALYKNKFKILDDHFKIAKNIQQSIGREGRSYAFGPTPVVWHKNVWKALDENYLQPNGKSIIDVIAQFPSELLWYGEALLRFRPIELLPAESLFKVYHYKWQRNQSPSNDIQAEYFKDIYLGVVNQSNWDVKTDWPPNNRSLFSKIRRILNKYN